MFVVVDGLENLGEKDLLFFMPYLNKQRTEKVESLRFLPDKIASACVFTLLRCMLETAGVSDCEFGFSETSKPYLFSRGDVFFSLSHDRKGVCACVSDREVGADIQELFSYEKALAERILSSKELPCFDNGVDKDRLLTRMWTLKESYSKMTGEGLAAIQNTDFSGATENCFTIGDLTYVAGEKGDLFYAVCSTKKEKVEFWSTDELKSRIKKLPKYF